MSAVSQGRTGTAESGRGDRDLAVFGIRGLAALALLTVHVAMFSGLLGTKALGTPRPPSNFLGAFFVSGMPSFIGVLFVFPALYLYLPLAKAIISGTRRPQRRGNFARRLLRLLPAYYAMYLVVLLALNRDAIDGIWYVLRPILLLQVYLPTPFAPNFVNGMEVTWTVPSMVQWYLALPLIAWASHRFAARGATPAARARRLMLPVPVLIAIGVVWLFVVKGNGWDNRMVFWWPQGFAPTIAIGMALAIMLALAQVSPGDTPRLLRAAASRPHLFWLGAALVYLVNCARPFSVIGMDAIYSTTGLLVTYLMVALFGLFAVLPLVSPGARRSRLTTVLLANRPVVHIGKVSYGVYLWHFAVMHFYLQPGNIISGHTRPIREFYGTIGFWHLELVTVAGSVLIATLSYRFLEQPIAAWGERLLRRRDEKQLALEPGSWRPARGPDGRPSGGDPGTDLAKTAPEDVRAVVASAVAQRDAIRSNLVDLERSFGRQLLGGGNLSGQTKRSWNAAAADLAALWEIFGTYSSVIDQAVHLLTGNRHPGTADLLKVDSLVNGPSIVLHGTPPPLSQRHITDTGQTHLTVAAAILRMNQLFAKTVELVTAAETVWNEVTGELTKIGADLARVRRRPKSAKAEAIAAAESRLHRLHQTLSTDPLSMWDNGRVNTEEVEALRRDVASLAGPVATHQ